MSRQDETQSESPDNALQDFDRRLDAARSKAGLDRKADGANGRGTASAWNMSVDFAAAVFVGTGLGLLIDRVAGTTPWVMLAGLFFGFAAGARNAFRTARRINESGGDQ